MLPLGFRLVGSFVLRLLVLFLRIASLGMGCVVWSWVELFSRMDWIASLGRGFGLRSSIVVLPFGTALPLGHRFASIGRVLRRSVVDCVVWSRIAPLGRRLCRSFVD